MKIQLALAVLLSCMLAAGCGDRGEESVQNEAENRDLAPGTGATGADQVNPAAPGAPAPSASASVDGSAAREDRPDVSGASTTGARTAPRPVPQTSAGNNHGGTAPEVAPGASRTVAPAAPRVTWRDVTVPANTIIPLELMTPLSSATAQVETPVRARVRQAVEVNGVNAIPAGATLIGEVFEVERAGRVQGRSRLAIRFNEMQANGASERLRTNPIIFEGEATKGEDATKIGVGAGIGAAIGGILGGGDGAAKGGAIGGAAGTGVVLATRGREVELATGAELSASLATPLEIRVDVR